jgi:hypothetical protein
MLPQITCSPAVGIKENVSLFASNVSVQPNPNAGLFNVIFTLTREQEVSLRVFSSIGQEIVSSKLKNVMNNVISVDLSQQPDGIYFAEISNGSDKTVKKIVVSH